MKNFKKIKDKDKILKKNNLAAPGFEPGLFMVMKFCFSQQFTSHGTSRGHPYYTLRSTY